MYLFQTDLASIEFRKFIVYYIFMPTYPSMADPSPLPCQPLLLSTINFRLRDMTKLTSYGECTECDE